LYLVIASQKYTHTDEFICVWACNYTHITSSGISRASRGTITNKADISTYHDIQVMIALDIMYDGKLF